MRKMITRAVAMAAGILALCGSAAASPSAEASANAGDDEVLYWNNVLLDRYREDFGTGCPCPLARAGAMVQVAVYDAVNSIDRQYEPYLDFVDSTPTASKEAAVAAAAYRTMIALFPNSRVELLGLYQNRLSRIPASADRAEGVRIGNRAARQILDARAADGSQLVQTYTFGREPGDYLPVPPNFSPVCDPQWTRVTPFAMETNTQFRPKIGPCGFRNMSRLLKSPQYAAQLNEVKSLGARNSTTRTDEQTRIAFFWANDINGTYKPPGHLFDITQVISRQNSLTLTQNARLFALVGLGNGDAGLVAWDAKYATDIDLWRPVTGIRRAHLDGNPLTERAPNWAPLNPFTPPFPAWISGHATFGAANAAVLAGYFGTDTMTFTIDSEDPFYNDLPVAGPRTFTSFSAAAVENGISRVYLGVHYRMDASDGNAAGFALGTYIARNFLNRLCVADYNRDGLTDSGDMFGFYDDYNTGDLAADLNNDGDVDMKDLDAFMNAYVNGC